jgi:ribose 5-phosphate isomerase A
MRPVKHVLMPVIMSYQDEKQAAAVAVLEHIHEGNIVGLGTGSTAAFAVSGLAEKVRAGLKIRGIPTSIQTHELATRLGIPLTTLDEFQQIDVAFDGADEVDPKLQLIKGAGGAFLREKIVASAAKKFIILADHTKIVSVLGKAPVPVEVVPFAQTLVAKEVEALGAKIKVRTDSSGGVYVTDEHHHILDCYFGKIDDPASLASKLDQIPGLVEHGLFINRADVVLVGRGREVEELRKSK